MLHVHVGADLGEGGVWVWVGDVFAGEDRDGAVGAVDILFCLGGESLD